MEFTVKYFLIHKNKRELIQAFPLIENLDNFNEKNYIQEWQSIKGFDQSIEAGLSIQKKDLQGSLRISENGQTVFETYFGISNFKLINFMAILSKSKYIYIEIEMIEYE